MSSAYLSSLYNVIAIPNNITINKASINAMIYIPIDTYSLIVWINKINNNHITIRIVENIASIMNASWGYVPTCKKGSSVHPDRYTLELII